ncbi:hypothetical protein BZA05DRAFT_385013 [Tricharina praecox]|uniref:uncharacterized protein n=1 Tax=Tricharina praecox TaxID=43433 RepID=UPI00221EF0F6|nr:uncharacterized protein BZA05DRAFT_385013 [Tricharina praecox]KAI5857845.1 hypothetical protein BZA05DRAFT_385013 [Tricharina praecox]
MKRILHTLLHQLTLHTHLHAHHLTWFGSSILPTNTTSSKRSTSERLRCVCMGYRIYIHLKNEISIMGWKSKSGWMTTESRI